MKDTGSLDSLMDSNSNYQENNPLNSTHAIFKYFGWNEHSDPWSYLVTCESRCSLEDPKEQNTPCSFCEERNLIASQKGESNGKEFITLDSKKNVRFWFKTIKHALLQALEVPEIMHSVVQYKPGCHYNDDGSITDFKNGTFNGILFEHYRTYATRDDVSSQDNCFIIVPILISSDSLTLFKHSVKDGYTSLSPMFMSILSIHPHVRYKYVNCIGLIPGPKPIKVDMFYLPFFKELKHLEKDGFLYKGSRFRVVLVMCTGDYRWIPKLTRHLSIPSPHACHICDMVGVYSIEWNQGQYRTQYRYLRQNHPLREKLKNRIVRKKGQSSVSYITQKTIYDCAKHTYKSNNHFIEVALKLSKAHKKDDAIERYGLKSLPILLNVLSLYNIYTQMLFDPMHIVILFLL